MPDVKNDEEETMKTVTTRLLTVLLLVASGGVSAQPITTNQWMDLYGYTEGLTAGSVIEVYDDDGVLAGQAQVKPDGKSYGFVHVYQDDPATPNLDEGADPGDQLLIKSAGQTLKTSVTPIYRGGMAKQQVDLVAGTVPQQIAANDQASTGGPGAVGWLGVILFGLALALRRRAD